MGDKQIFKREEVKKPTPKKTASNVAVDDKKEDLVYVCTGTNELGIKTFSLQPKN